MIRYPARTANVLLAGYSYLKSTITGVPGISGMPLSIGTELTNHCNLNCPECSSGSGMMQRERGFMDPDLFNKIIDELRPYLYNINLYFQGEPMMHPQFFSFLDKCAGLNSVVSTNGHFLSEENAEKIAGSGLSKLIISLDGFDQDTYSLYRVNGSFDKVISGIKSITTAKKKFNSSLKIEIQFLVNKINECQIPQLRQFSKFVGASLSLKSMQIIHKENILAWLPGKRHFSRYHFKNGEYSLKSSLPHRCARLWFNPVITWSGKVVPCCFDKDAEYVMGDLNIDSFSDIWNGTKYQIFRKSILSGRHMIDICRNCTSGLKGVRY